MFKPVSAFSGFSVDDEAKAKAFYTDKLGLKIEDNGMGLQIKLPGGGTLFIYAKDDHKPATYTVLNFVVADIDAAVAELKKSGVQFEHYDGPGPIKTDADGIARGKKAGMGPDIAWFTDPAGNILSVIEDGE